MNRAIRLALLGSLLCCAAVAGNVGQPPSIPGRLTAELGGANTVQVERETLRFDLRPLQDSNEVGVHVTYVLQNPEGVKTLGLMFVGGHDIADDIAICLDTQPIPGKVTRANEVPEMWRPSWAKEKTWGSLVGWKFPLVLPPGKHILELRYRALARYRHDRNPTRLWELRYLLTPARSWHSFGVLDLELQCPEGWNVTCSLPVTSEGNTLRGTYQGLPADDLSIYANLQVESFATLLSTLITTFSAVGFLGLLACAGSIVRAIRLPRSESIRLALQLGGWMGVMLWALVLVLVAVCWSKGPTTMVPSTQRQLPYGYFDLQLEACLIPVMVVFLGLAMLMTAPTLAAAWAVRRRQRRESSKDGDPVAPGSSRSPGLEAQSARTP